MTTLDREMLAEVVQVRVRGGVSWLPTAEQLSMAVWPKGMDMEVCVVVMLSEEAEGKNK